MPDEPGEIEVHSRLSSLPSRALSESEVEALSADAEDVEITPASIRASTPPEVTSVFIEREATLQVAGFSPSEDVWCVYARWTDREKSDRSVYELVSRWDERYYDELTAERMERESRGTDG